MKTYLRYSLLCFLLFFCAFRQSYATHIVGGELEMVFVNGNNYRFNMVMYFDAVNGNVGAIDPSARIHIFQKSNNRYIQSFDLPRVSDVQVAYTNPACARGNLSTRKIGYSFLANLNPNTYNAPGGYYVVWERCCRNGIINNITNPGGAGQTFYLEFPPLLVNGTRFINSTPSLNPPLSDYACVNQNFFFDFKGSDIDGDELRYSLSHPLNGSSTANDPAPQNPVPAPYTLVNFIGGLGVNNMIPGNPPLNISRQGIVTLRASRTGLHVFAVKCEEFRNGVKIGEMRRDFQLLVLDCPTANPPDVQAVNFVSQGGNVVSARDTLVLNASETNPCTNLEIRDIDPNTVVKVRINPINFTSSAGILTSTTGNINGAGSVLRVPICFPFCPPTTTTYTMDVIVEDNSCAVPLLDTTRVNVRVVNPINQRPKVTTSLTTLSGNTYSTTAAVSKSLSFSVIGDDADKDFIALSMIGVGFNPASVGMSFANISGNPILRQNFTWTPPCDLFTKGDTTKSRTYNLRFPITDRRRCGSNLTDTTNVRITINNPFLNNKKPAIKTSVLKYDSLRKFYYDTVVVRSTIRFDVLGDDVDKDTVRVSFTGIGAATGLGATMPTVTGLPIQTGKFVWTPPCNAVNTVTNPNGQSYDFLFTVNDLVACNAGLQDTTRVRIFVKPLPNRKPTISSTLKFDAATKIYYDTVYVRNKIEFDLLGDDVDKDTVLINYRSLTGAISGATLTNTKGSPILRSKFTWNVPCSAVEPTNFAGKAYNFNFYVNDLPPCLNGLSDTIKVRIFVKPINNLKPTITAALPFDAVNKIYYDSVRVGGTFRFPVTGNDPEKDSIMLYMQGLNGINPTALGMTFTYTGGKAPRTGTFNWRTFCGNLDDTLKAKDYNLRFVVQDFDACGNSKFDTLRVRLRVLPNTVVNNQPITTTSLGNLKYNAATKTYTDTIKMKTLYQFDVLADDIDKDSLLLTGNGIGFTFASASMQFTSQRGRPILKSTFTWQPVCELLPAGQASRVFNVRFITQDFRDCQRSKYDTITVRLVLVDNPAENQAPVATPTVLNLVSRKTYNYTVTAGETLNFKVRVTDNDRDSVSISATGLADGMSFTGLKAIAPLERDFSWVTNCSIFGNTITPKDYSLTFLARDFKSCGLPKFDTIRVNLRLIPQANPNPPRLSFTDSTTFARTLVRGIREFTKTVKPGEAVSLLFSAIDLDKDIVTIDGLGEGFTMADFGMKFNNVRGIAPQQATFEWAVDCDILKRRQDFRIRFITQDQVTCKPTKSDTLYVNFKVIDIDGGRDFKPYNVFTPNGDGKNDTFRLDIPNDNCQDTFIKIIIYNRWGKLVFESTDRNFAWEGSGFPAGVYYYYVEFKNKKFNNSVTLLRDE